MTDAIANVDGGWLAGWERWPCWWLGACHLFRQPITHLVLHCGSHRSDVARYMANPVDAPGTDGAILCRDGQWRRRVATHWAWSDEHGTFVQQLPITLEGWGTGASEWRGVRLNRCAVHVELPGPPSQARDGVQMGELVRLATGLRLARPSLGMWLRHSDVDAEKRDPGPGVPDDWAGGLLRYCPS